VPRKAGEPGTAVGQPTSYEEGDMRVVVAAALTAGVALATAASAQQSQGRPQCLATAGVPLEQQLADCTALIESGQQTQRGLAMLYNTRANAYFAKQDLDRAIQDYNSAIMSDPNYNIPFNNRGLAYQRKGQSDRAFEDFDQAIRLDPKYAAAFGNRGDLQRLKGRLELAIADYDQAITLNPNLADAFLGRGIAYQEKSQWDFDAYLNEGRYEALGIQSYDQAIRINPNNGVAFSRRGFLSARLRQYDRAVSDYSEAIRLDPNSIFALYGRADAYRFTRQYDRAIADYRKLLTLKIDGTMKTFVDTVLRRLAGVSVPPTARLPQPSASRRPS
jgi:tetratricopeptide (TPR) repeat protein